MGDEAETPIPARYVDCDVFRVNPWGESLPWKQAGDDSPQDGSHSDTATTHRETRETPSQMPLTSVQESKPSATGD